MTREEKCQLAIEKGFTYNPETGKIYGIKGKEINNLTNGYIRILLYDNNKKIYLKGHHFAWYWVNKECLEFLDHINGIRNDNHICNLRGVTHQQNMWNKTKAKGYSWYKKSNKWRVKISFNNKKIHIGYFDNEEDARAAYLEAKEKYHKINS